MTAGLIESLNVDHRRIQALGHELIAECGGAEPSENACFSHFRTFKALASAQAKAEEYTIYALFEEGEFKDSAADMRRYVLEAYEENDLIDLMLKEMGQAEELTDQFRAKLHVLLNLLDRHILEEERRFLPRLVQVLPENKLFDLAVIYAREREAIFAKKSGLRKPAPEYTNRNLITH